MRQAQTKRAREEALNAAQEVMWDAWDSNDKRKRVALAKHALELSSDCADAHTMLALETATTAEQKIALFREAVAAGERALGKKAFKELAGYFWGFVETRPYMRARHYLGMELWDAGRREEAVANYREMLRLNPNDNQGIRYLLINCLLALGDDDGVEELLAEYEDDGGVEWMWARPLVLFRRHGDGAASRRAQKAAIAANGHVPDYLLGRKKMPRRLPDLISPGGEDEAISYMHSGAQAWAATPGAIEWLAQQCAEPARARGQKARRA